MRITPWRQGSVLSSDAIKALKLQHDDSTFMIVITHDCDLAQSPDNEPYVEIITGYIIKDKDGNCTHAKNSRKLHIEFTLNENPLWLEFEAITKTHVTKKDLFEFSPREDIRLVPDSLAIFQKWLASRYRRSAFPDKFEEHLKKSRLGEKIAKAVKPHGEQIVGVFFDVDKGEDINHDEINDPYVLDIIILYSADIDGSQQNAELIAGAINSAFRDKLFIPNNKWQSIELRLCEAVSESVLSYREFKQLKSWRLEHISLAAVPQQPVLDG
jgi:hypothetical protein